MITTHIHTITNKAYSLREIQFGIGQFHDGAGAVMCCAMNSGLMRPAAEREYVAPEPIHLKRAFVRVNHVKFNAMMFMEGNRAAVSQIL